jgi:hypothetical protein
MLGRVLLLLLMLLLGNVHYVVKASLDTSHQSIRFLDHVF